MADEPIVRQDTTGDYNASAQGGGGATVNVTNIYQATPQPVSSAYREIAGVPPPTDQQFIEQRTPLVEAIAARLLQPQVNVLVLTGIGGVGKSTLAALLYRYVQTHQQSDTFFFAVPPLWLSVDRSATFADVVGTLYHQLNKALPDLASLSPANQAGALFNLLDSLDVPHLVVLDQFENLLDWSTGFALPTKAGVGEWLDALNSQPWTGRSRVLLTSRPRPKGTREYPPIYVQEYPVDGLTLAEGIDLLQKRGVQAAEAELRRVVESCNGHALSLTLLIALVQEYGISLASLLGETGLWEGDIATNLLDAVFQQLSETQRELLRAFSVFRRSVPLAAAQELIIPAVVDQALTALRSLLVQHLIQRAGDGSYQLHAIVASYARQHFIEGDRQANQQAVQQAYAKAAAYYLQQAQTTCPPREQRHSLSEVQPIVEAVWQYTQAAQWQEAYTLIEEEDLFEQLSLWGGNVLLLELCQPLLPHEGWQPVPEQEAALCNYLGQVHDVLGQKQEALDYFQQALTIHREVGDRRGEGTTLNNLGRVYDDMGKKQEALDYFQLALAIRREVGDRGGEGLTLDRLGLIYDSQGQKQQALDYFQQALAIHREVGDRRGEGVTMWSIGAFFFQQQDDVALAALLLAREAFKEVQSPSYLTVQEWIDALHNQVGEQQFAFMLTQVKPHTQHLVEQALSRKQR